MSVIVIDKTLQMWTSLVYQHKIVFGKKAKQY